MVRVARLPIRLKASSDFFVKVDRLIKKVVINIPTDNITNPYFHNISVTAIIHKRRKYLITKRSPNKKAFPNKWTVPGGKIEVNDYINLPKTTPAAWYGAVTYTLKREVKEEVNLEMENIRRFCLGYSKTGQKLRSY